MKKNQNTLPKPSFALPTFNRSLKLMALALVSLVAGVGNTNAQTPAIVGRTILLSHPTSATHYLTQEQYQAVMSRKNTNWERDEILGIPIIYQNNELRTYNPEHPSGSRVTYKIQDYVFTNNGLMTKYGNNVYLVGNTPRNGIVTGYYRGPGETYAVQTGTHSPIVTRQLPGPFVFIDFNELAVNRAMSAAPIGTLKVTPSNNASEQTKVQWSVE
jgi:hypothetical protein